MLRTRVLPALLLRGRGLVKTIRFRSPEYIGDPINAARIFNELEVDELVLFDIDASAKRTGVQHEYLESVVSECFMPVCYGGGVKHEEDFRRLFCAGIEKISVSSLLFEQPDVVRTAVDQFGSQAIVATLDVSRSRFKREHVVRVHNAKRAVGFTLDEALRLVNDLDVGEVIVNSIDRDGTWAGFDCELIAHVQSHTDVPVVALGGGGELHHIRKAVHEGQASAVALGSMAVYQAKGMGVLINFPTLPELERVLAI